MIPTTKHKSLYHVTALDIADLINEKQSAYGRSFDKSGGIMRVLYPDGIKPHQIDDTLCIIRIIDKLFRIANNKNAFGESPWNDILGYALLAATRDRIGQVNLYMAQKSIDQAFKAIPKVVFRGKVKRSYKKRSKYWQNTVRAPRGLKINNNGLLHRKRT